MALRSILSLTMVVMLGLSAVPAPAACQMAYGNFLASGCRMPCCQANIPMRNCPTLKASAPRDFIASSVPILVRALIPLHGTVPITLQGLLPVSEVLATLAAAAPLLIFGPPPSVRAPPPDVHLLDA